jgi:hypothetical protein
MIWVQWRGVVADSLGLLELCKLHSASIWKERPCNEGGIDQEERNNPLFDLKKNIQRCSKPN